MSKLIQIKKKKSVMGSIIQVFVLVLVIAILSGLTFLFTAQLKTQVLTISSNNVNSTAYQAVNQTEAAGYTVITFLPLVFLALIFGAILMVVLKVILPYINLGQSVGGF